MKRKWTAFVLLAFLVFALAASVQAQEQPGYVTDRAELLTYEQWQKLEQLCGSVSAETDCSVYIVTLEDFADYGSDVYDAAYGIYHQYALGDGSGRNGIMLLLSMAERDYATYVYGDAAERVFSDYVLRLLEDEFLPEFADDDWYGGFFDFVSDCRSFLADGGQEVCAQKDITNPILWAVGISFAVSLIVVLTLRSGMKSVRAGTEAGTYVSRDLVLTQRSDRFTHMTKTQRKIETSSGSSSGSRSGGGGHGRSGKF